MKFIHVSDTHLGCQIPVEYSEIRKKDFLKSFNEVIDFAIKEKVDFIIHSGDFFDEYFRIDSKYIIEVLDILSKLKENDIPLIFIKGNHDTKGQRQNILEILKKLKLVYEANIKEPFIYKDIYIYGISEPPNLAGEELNLYYKNILSKLKFENNGYTIFMFHGAVNFFPNSILEGYHKEPRILSLEYFPKADYYAFGHFHKHYLEKNEGKIFALPGSTERTEISKDEENIKKGFYLVNDNDIKFIELNTRPIYIYEDIINNEEDINKISEDVGKRSKEAIIKIKIRYKKDYYQRIKSLVDSLISLGYLIIEDLYSLDREEDIIEENNYSVEDALNSLFFINNKEEVISLFNTIKERFEEMYSGRESDIDRIRDNLFKELLK
ncbi:DNA double-strand break repair protein Mre11 [Nanoarchaeota archaeon]